MDRRAAAVVDTADKGPFLRRTKSPPEGGLDRTRAEGSLDGGRAPLQAAPPKVQISPLDGTMLETLSWGSSKVVVRPEGESDTDYRGQDQKF